MPVRIFFDSNPGYLNELNILKIEFDTYLH